MDLPMPADTRGTTPARRLIAAGFIRRLPGRTLTLRATLAGVTGTITPHAAATAQRLDDDSDDACPFCGYWTCRCRTAHTARQAVAAR